MTIEQANEYFSSLPEGFAPAEELSAALTADARKVQFVGVAGTPQRPSAPQSLCPAQRQSWRLRPAASVRQTVSWLWWSCRMQVWRLPCPVCRSAPSQPSAPTA